MGVLGIVVNDWVAIFFEIVWEFERVIIDIPAHVWLSIILAVGVNILDRNYPKSVNSSENPEELTPRIKVENIDSNTETSSKDLEGATTP